MESCILSELLECSVCLEPLNHLSKVLPCQHTFCRNCLQDIIDSHKELRCPECRVLVSSKIDDLPPNILLMRILEGIKKKTKPETKVKKDNEVEIPVVSDTLISQTVAKSVPSKSEVILSSLSNASRVNQSPILRAQALYSYEKKVPSDLTFKKGDIVTLLKKIDANWYQGELNGVCGFIPASYVQGDNIRILRRIDENWTEGKLNNKKGIFPISFVELNNSAKALMKLSINTQKGPSRTAPMPPTDVGKTPLIINEDMCDPQQSFSQSSSSSSSAVASPEVASNPFLSTSFVQQYTSEHQKSCALIGAEQHASPHPPKRSFEKESGKFSSDDSNVVNKIASVKPKVQSLTMIKGTFKDNCNMYIAHYLYNPQKVDELELRRGCLYAVSDKCQDGWFKGYCLKTMKSGVFPGNYVKLANSQDIAAYLSEQGEKMEKRKELSSSGHVQLSQTNYSSGKISSGETLHNEAVVSQVNLTLLDTPVILHAPMLSPVPSSLSRPFSPNASEFSPMSDLSVDVAKQKHQSPLHHENISACDGYSEAQNLSESIDTFGKTDKKAVSSSGGLIKRLGQKSSKQDTLINSVDNPACEELSKLGLLTKNTCEVVPGISQSSSKASPELTAAKNKQLVPLVRERYRCIVPYPPNSDYELELQVGDIIFVHKKRSDGWCKGTLQRTGKTGLFPASFVEPY